MATVLVTGATRGLGREFVTQYAQAGHTVLATARTPQDHPDLARLASRVLPLEASSEASIQALGRSLEGTPIDLLINNAGVSADDRKLGGLNMASFEKVFVTNTFAPALIAQALLPSLRAGGRKTIVNISSQLGSITNANPGFSYAYNASKAALNMVTARLAKDLAGEGFIVVSLHPGWVQTDMGGPQAPLRPPESIRQMIATIDRLTKGDTGSFRNYDGAPMPW